MNFNLETSHKQHYKQGIHKFATKSALSLPIPTIELR